MIKQCIEQLMQGDNLTAEQCQQVMHEILNDANPLQVAAFITLLHAKGETAEEVFGIATELQKVMLPVAVNHPVLDIVGTGGDGANTVNISTASSIVAASCGAKVAKHGSRAVSSKCGSSNVLQEFGVNIDMTPEQVTQSIDEVGIGFCYAPRFHPAWVKVKEIRSALGVRTLFNVLGPLLNPARAKHMLIGVFDPKIMPMMAETLQRLGVKHAMVVHSQGLDELSLIGPAEVIEVNGTGLQQKQLDPQQFDLAPQPLSAIQGDDAATNAKLIQAAFAGEQGAIADTIVLNAGVGLYVADLVSSIEEGIQQAQNSLQTGAAQKTLQQWVAYSRDQSNA